MVQRICKPVLHRRNEANSARWRRCLPLLVLAVIWPGAASAFNFTPTEAEWQRWPGYCKGKYVSDTKVGRRSRFAGLATPADIEQMRAWEDSGLVGLHHYCAGMLLLERAKYAESPEQRRRVLNRARDETDYAARHTNPTSPAFASVAIQKSSIDYEEGDKESALGILVAALEVLPSNDVLYSATAAMLYKMDQKPEARDTLLAGLQATGGRSPEIYYNLGLLSLELGDIEGAENYATLAYQGGYPLRGLARKLAQAKND